MKPTASLLVALLATISHAYSHAPTSTASGLDDLLPTATPYPGMQYGDLRARQNLGVNGNAGADPNQVSPVTTYSILSQVGATAVPETYVYTQRFVRVPDQFPAARSGQIGYGTLHQKREVEARATPAINTGIAGRIEWR